MDPFDTKVKKRKTSNHQNFIEAFKDIGASTIKTFTKDVVAGTGKNAVDSLTKPFSNDQTNPTEQPFNFEEYLNRQEKQLQARQNQRFETFKREETVLFSREQQQVKLQIETLQVQIKDLAKEQSGLMEEIDQAAFQAVTNPGVYHKNFFERLLQLIKIARKKISESHTWLSLHNHRAKQRSAYWQGVNNKGTSFMLSGERTIATQSG